MEYILEGKRYTDEREIRLVRTRIINNFKDRILAYGYGFGYSGASYPISQKMKVSTVPKKFKNCTQLLKISLVMSDGDTKELSLIDFGTERPLYERYKLSFEDSRGQKRLTNIPYDNNLLECANFLLKGKTRGSFDLTDLILTGVLK